MDIYLHRGPHNPLGDGMEWLAAFPLAVVFFALVLPALVLGAIGRGMRTAAILVVLAVGLDVIIWYQIWAEFVGKTVH